VLTRLVQAPEAEIVISSGSGQAKNEKIKEVIWFSFALVLSLNRSQVGHSSIPSFTHSKERFISQLVGCILCAEVVRASNFSDLHSCHEWLVWIDFADGGVVNGLAKSGNGKEQWYWKGYCWESISESFNHRPKELPLIDGLPIRNKVAFTSGYALGILFEELFSSQQMCMHQIIDIHPFYQGCWASKSKLAQPLPKHF